MNFELSNVRFKIMVPPEAHGNTNDDLPHADTCFFHFELPHYTSFESCDKKIRTAINICNSLNGDMEVEMDLDPHH